MKKAVYIFILFLLNGIGYSQINFFKTYGATGSADVGDDIIRSQNGGYVVLSHGSFNPPLNSKVNLGFIKTDIAGTPVHITEMKVDTSCVGKKILELPNQDYLVLGTATSSSFTSSSKLFLLKVNNTGTPIWCYRYNVTPSDQAVDIKATADGNFLILATVNYNISYEEMLLIKITPGGNIIWSKRIAATGKELTPASMAVFTNGDIGIAGTVSENSFLNTLVMRLSGSGDIIWAKRLSTTYDDYVEKVLINGINEVFVGGYSYHIGTEWDIYIAKLDENGDLKFQYFYDGGSTEGEKLRDMELASGRIAIIGDRGSFDARNMFLTSVYTTGSIYFCKQYPYITSVTNYPFGLEVINNNEYAFTGDIYTPMQSRDAGLLKTDALCDMDCNTAALQLQLTNQEFTISNIALTSTNPTVAKTNMPVLNILPNIFPQVICEHIPPVAAFDTTTHVTNCPQTCFSFADFSLYNPTGWKWYFEGGTPDTSTLQDPTGICWKNSGSYKIKLVVSNNIGFDSITKLLKVDIDCPVIIPNVFTPNNDGTNDTWELTGLPEEFELILFDRWGIKVFETNSPLVMWNGKINNTGMNATDGVYYYVLNDITHKKQYSNFIHVFQ